MRLRKCNAKRDIRRARNVNVWHNGSRLRIVKEKKSVGHEPAHCRLLKITLKRPRQPEPNCNPISHLLYGLIEKSNLAGRVARGLLDSRQEMVIFDDQQPFV